MIAPFLSGSLLAMVLLAMVLVGDGNTMVGLLTNTSSSIGKVEHKVLKRIISLKNFARQER